MTAPAFNDPFNAFYDQYSIAKADFSIPAHFNVYVPERKNQLDFDCLSVISPSPQKGATQWTYRDRWLTIGIYRDEGREAASRPPTVGLNWSRSTTTLTIVDPAGHRLKTGDLVDLYNVNVTDLPKKSITVINSTTFTVKTLLYGSTSGNNGSYQPSEEYNFFEKNCVFRILPSFKLVPYAVIQQLLIDSSPSTDPQLRQMYNVTTDSLVKLPRGKNKSVNYDLPASSKPVNDRLSLARRFNQIYDEAGDPLPINYREDGMPVELHNYDAPNLDEHRALNQPQVNEISPGDDSSFDSRVYVYDFYGCDVNDPNRGPYFASDLITRDTTISAPYNNIKRKGQNGVPYYAGKLYDGFGNYVLGIQENNSLAIRENLLPLVLDRFNHPVKNPITHTGQLEGF